MKQHQIALEQAGKRFGGLVGDRLMKMYDRAVARMDGDEEKTIKPKDTFPVNIFEVHFTLNDALISVVRVLDIENGHYVKLVKQTTTSPALLEVGLMVIAEEITQGQSNIRAW